jgi:hypothetical protein
MKEAHPDSSHLYEVERRVEHAARPGFRILELQLSPTQKVPWHSHTNISDTFYVLEGNMKLFLQDPKEEVNLKPGWLGPAFLHSQDPKPTHAIVASACGGQSRRGTATTAPCRRLCPGTRNAIFYVVPRPALAHCSSWSPVTPLTPTPPVTLPSTMTGTPPGEAKTPGRVPVAGEPLLIASIKTRVVRR